MTASPTWETAYPGARYHRLMPRLGKKKALVALEHSLLTALWHMLTQDTEYADLSGGYYARCAPERAMHLTRQAHALGFTVHFNPTQTA
ncbi:hypothetical protein [Streptomyces olivoreticuli]|uniref:hypothetical protein n=1 Tax=Streptomyces olivoreticuli TaxID=68246 RepID=UPI001F079685|nr:hypothetical protein [Streptomyces olivoreticuli]